MKSKHNTHDTTHQYCGMFTEELDSTEVETSNERIKFLKKILQQKKQKKCRNNQKKSSSDKNHVGTCGKKKKQTNDQNKEVGANRTKRKQRKQ